MRTFCKLWQFCPSSHPATVGKAVRMARAGGWHGCVYFNKAQRLKFHQCPSAVCYIHSFITIHHFPLQLHFRIVVSWISIIVQGSSDDPAPKQGIQDPSQDAPCNPSPGINLWDTEPLSACRDRTVVLHNLFCYGQAVQKSRKESEKAGEYVRTGRRIDKREKEWRRQVRGLKMLQQERKTAA